MEPITLVATALAAGAALGAKETASSALKDAYAALKALAKRRLGARPETELMLAQHEKAPRAWRESLVDELARAGADHDLDLLAAAQALMNMVDEPGAQAGKYKIDIQGAQGVQIGDRNRQDNVFQTPLSD